MDEEFESQETQWTSEARRTYEQKIGRLGDALRAHATLTLAREGRAREWEPYISSADELRACLREFRDAEFDWCGSAPYALDVDEDDDLDGGTGEEEDDGSSVLSVFIRQDFVLEDEQQVIVAGRDSYLEAWPSDTTEDARLRVSDAGAAALEVVHARGIGALREVGGMQLSRDELIAIRHDGTDDDDRHPFALADTSH